MFCKKCGNKLNEGENFCSKCGNNVKLINLCIDSKESIFSFIFCLLSLCLFIIFFYTVLYDTSGFGIVIFGFPALLLTIFGMCLSIDSIKKFNLGKSLDADFKKVE